MNQKHFNSEMLKAKTFIEQRKSIGLGYKAGYNLHFIGEK